MTNPVDVGEELITVARQLIQVIERYMEDTRVEPEIKVSLEAFVEQMAAVLRRSGFDDATARRIAEERIAEMERQNG